MLWYFEQTRGDDALEDFEGFMKISELNQQGLCYVYLHEYMDGIDLDKQHTARVYLDWCILKEKHDNEGADGIISPASKR